jgi:hypothetical protein
VKWRVGLWLLIGAALVLGGYAMLALQTQPNPKRRDYEAAVEYVRSFFPGGEVWTSPYGDPRTSVERRDSDGVIVVKFVMRTDHPDVARYGAVSPTGEYRVTYRMLHHRNAGGLVRSDSTHSWGFSPLR